MATESAEESAQSNVSFSIFFPMFFGVLRAPPLPPGSVGPAVPDRIVMLNPLSQRMVIFQGSGGDAEGGQDPMAVLMRELMMVSAMDVGRGPSPASKASIMALKTVEDVVKGECPVCLEEFGRNHSEEGGDVKEMPCRHKYHGQCIGKWLGMNGSCPVCRYRMPEEDEGAAKKVEGDGDVWLSFGLNSEAQQNHEQQESQQHELRQQQHEEENSVQP